MTTLYDPFCSKPLPEWPNTNSNRGRLVWPHPSTSLVRGLGDVQRTMGETLPETHTGVVAPIPNSPAMASESLSETGSSQPQGKEFAGGDSVERHAPISRPPEVISIVRMRVNSQHIRLVSTPISKANAGPGNPKRLISSGLLDCWGLFLSVNWFGPLARGLSASRIQPSKQAFRGLFKAFLNLSFGSVLGHVDQRTEELKGCQTKEFPKTAKMFPRIR